MRRFKRHKFQRLAEWHRWFAWRPIWIFQDKGYLMVWWEWVYRRGKFEFEFEHGGEQNWRWEYQLKVEDIT